MKKLFGPLLFIMVVACACSAQLTIPMGGSPSSDTNRKAPRATSRILTGTVTEKSSEKPIPEAIVYLKNTKTLAMKTYITQSDGSYRFPEVSNNTDYEVYAQKDGRKSSTKTLSQFDDRPSPAIHLQISMNK